MGNRYRNSVIFIPTSKVEKMKKSLFIFIAAGLLTACQSQQRMEKNSVTVTSTCPKDGNCTVEVFKNKSMLVEKDQYGNLFYKVVENPNRNVIKYEYNRIVKDTMLQDAGYREEIVFETDSKFQAIADKDPNQMNMLFGRFLFSRENTGYFIVKDRDLSISKDGKKSTVDLKFKVEGVPQIITSFSAKVE